MFRCSNWRLKCLNVFTVTGDDCDECCHSNPSAPQQPTRNFSNCYVANGQQNIARALHVANGQRNLVIVSPPPCCFVALARCCHPRWIRLPMESPVDQDPGRPIIFVQLLRSETFTKLREKLGQTKALGHVDAARGRLFLWNAASAARGRLLLLHLIRQAKGGRHR